MPTGCITDIDDGTPSHQAETLNSAVSTICGFFEDNGWLDLSLTVHTSSDSEKLATLLREHGGPSPGRALYNWENLRTEIRSGGIGPNRVAIVDANILSGGEYWSRQGLNELSSLVLSWSCDCTNVVPYWLFLGSSEVVTQMALAHERNQGYPRFNWYRDEALEVGPNLEGIGRYPRYRYHARVAVELLAHVAGLNSIVDFFNHSYPYKTGWRRHFERVFGIAIDDFYILYTEHWNNGLPDLTVQLNIDGESAWPTVDDLPQVPTVDTLKPNVQHGIVQVSSQGRTGSGFIYQVDDDGTVWIFTDDYLVGPDENGTVTLRLFNHVQTTTGIVRGVHPDKLVAVISTCCHSDIKPLSIAAVPLPLAGPPAGRRVIIFAIDAIADRLTDVSGTIGKIFGLSTGIDGRVEDNVNHDYIGGTAFNDLGEVVGIVSYPRWPHEGLRLWMTEVNPISLRLDEIIGESDRFREYDSSHGLPSYLAIPYEDELDRLEANAIRIGANAFDTFATDLKLPTPDNAVKIYVHGNRDILERYYEEEERRSIEFRFRGLSTDRAVYLIGADSSVRHVKLQHLEYQQGLLAHELTHTIFQKSVGVGPRPPRWIIEGMASYFAGLVRAHNQNRSFSSVQSSFEMSNMIPPSSTDEFYKWNSDGGPCDYVCGIPAVRLLASRVGVRGLVSFFENGRADTPWQTTFQQTFGLTVAEFYDLFAEHIDAGFPDLRIPDDPFPEN